MSAGNLRGETMRKLSFKTIPSVSRPLFRGFLPKKPLKGEDDILFVLLHDLPAVFPQFLGETMRPVSRKTMSIVSRPLYGERTRLTVCLLFLQTIHELCPLDSSLGETIGRLSEKTGHGMSHPFFKQPQWFRVV